MFVYSNLVLQIHSQSHSFLKENQSLNEENQLKKSSDMSTQTDEPRNIFITLYILDYTRPSKNINKVRRR